MWPPRPPGDRLRDEADAAANPSHIVILHVASAHSPQEDNLNIFMIFCKCQIILIPDISVITSRLTTSGRHHGLGSDRPHTGKAELHDSLGERDSDTNSDLLSGR